MEDKQIIELYWNRSDDAIKETEVKYGKLCAYITSHILQNEEDADCCVKECYERLWASIPPRRPQNLKVYLCKVTRDYALHMKYKEVNEQEGDLFTAELVVQDFLKGLEPVNRKLFMAYYWYFSSILEIAQQYKMSEHKVETTLRTLRQRLDTELELKNIRLQTEEALLYAMTEVEDRYLEEAEPAMMVLPETISPKGMPEEKQNQDTKKLFVQRWKKYQIPVIICALCLILLVLVWPKNPVEQNPTESQMGGAASDSEKPNTETINTDEVVLDDLISIVGGGTFHKDDLVQLKALHPWNEEKEIATLPVYKNLSFIYDGQKNVTAYMDEYTLLQNISDIAEKLNMKMISVKVDKVDTGDEQNEEVVCGAQVTTDTGSIQVDATGKITVSFTEGVQLPAAYDMSDSTTVEHANNDVVTYLMEKYADIISVQNFVSNSYPTYDEDGNRTMHFRAIVDSGGISEVEKILDYNFNQVEFYYNRGLGLTGFSYGDIRFAAELLGYYPIISLEEAKVLLREGNLRSEYFGSEGLSYEEEDVLAVELMYKIDEWENVYQPYYCFYILSAVDNLYARCYVPAVEGARVDGVESEVEDIELQGVEIIDLSE